MSKHAIIAALLASCVASGIYWNYRSGQAANEARLLEERVGLYLRPPHGQAEG